MDLSPLYLSLKISLISTLLIMVTGILAAWLVSRLPRGHGLVDGLLTLPMILPPTVIGFFLLLLLGKNGWIGYYFNQFGVSIIFTWIAGVVASTVVAFPLMYRTVRGAIEQIDVNLVNAARTLGFSEWKVFRRVVLPNIIPGVLAGTVLSFARALGEFGATVMIAGNIPGRTRTMSLAIYSAVQAGSEHYNEAYLWTAIICTISIITMMIINLWNKQYYRTTDIAG